MFCSAVFIASAVLSSTVSHLFTTITTALPSSAASSAILRTGTQIDTTATNNYTDPAPPPASYWYQVQALDAAGNESFRTPPIRVDITGADTTRPTTPRDLAATIEPNGDVGLTWTPSTDNVAVTEYRILRTGTQVDTTAGTSYTDPAPSPGSYWYQVQALDAAGNESFRTPPIRVDI